MTHQQEFLCVLVALPICVIVGAIVGKLTAFYGKAIEIAANERKALRVVGKAYWLVTDEEYERLKRCRLLDRVR